jgi:hypothetical protein
MCFSTSEARRDSGRRCLAFLPAEKYAPVKARDYEVSAIHLKLRL